MLEKRQTDPKPAQILSTRPSQYLFSRTIKFKTAQLGGNPICQSTSQDG